MQQPTIFFGTKRIEHNGKVRFASTINFQPSLTDVLRFSSRKRALVMAAAVALEISRVAGGKVSPE